MKNTRKILAVLLSLVILLSCASLFCFAADKKDVKKIVLSNYKYTVYYNESVVSKPNLTAASDVPYKPSPINVKLEIKKDGEWKDHGASSPVREGTYRWSIQVRIDGDNAKNYKFASKPSVYVDKKSWTAGAVANAASYSTIIIYSPSFKITSKDARPGKTKIKSVTVSVPTYYSKDKIPTSYSKMSLSGKGFKWSEFNSPRVYCHDIQSGALSSGTTFKKGKNYTIYLYVEPDENYEFTSSTTVKLNGKKADDVSLLKNRKGVYELLIKYSFKVQDKPEEATTAKPTTTKPTIKPNSSNGGLMNTIKNLFKSAFGLFTNIFKFFK